MEQSLWTRWKAFARAAAAVQSNAILWLLYYLLFLPIALLQRPFTDPLGQRANNAPRWGDVTDGPQDAARAHQQF